MSKEDFQEVIEEVKKGGNLKLLRDPNLFDNLNASLDPIIQNEVEVRKAILLVTNGRNVANPNDPASYNLLINDESGKGKDYVTSRVLSVIPDNELIARKRVSNTTFTYWHNAKYDPNWTWDKKIFYGEDVPRSVLNSDVFKIMLSSGNATSTIVKNQKAEDIVIKGKPTVIVTCAELVFKNENLRRLPTIHLTNDVEQTKKVMVKQSIFAKLGVKQKEINPYKEAFSLLERVPVVIPFADAIAECFPAKHYIMRTNFPRFLDYIKSSCSLHQFQRAKDDSGNYISTQEDYEIASKVFASTISNELTIPLSNKQQRILDVLGSIPHDSLTATQISNYIKSPSRRRLPDYLDKLVELGFLTSNTSPVFYKNKDGNEQMGREATTYKLNIINKFMVPPYDQILSTIAIMSNMSNMTLMSTSNENIQNSFVHMSIPPKSKKSILSSINEKGMDTPDNIDMQNHATFLIKILVNINKPFVPIPGKVLPKLAKGQEIFVEREVADVLVSNKLGIEVIK